LLDLALAGLERAVVAHFHEAARRHLGPMQPERDLVVAVVGAGHAQGEMVEDALVEPVHHGETMRGGEINPRLPLCRGHVDAALDRFQKHGWSPSVPIPKFANARAAISCELRVRGTGAIWP